jgi:hypothetical protein
VCKAQNRIAFVVVYLKLGLRFEPKPATQVSTLDITLLFLPGPVLTDRLFMRDFFARVKGLQAKFLLLYAPPEADERQTRFAGKRLSANLSEGMVPNVEYGGDQRGLITRTDNGVRLRTDLLLPQWEHLQAVVLNTLILEADDSVGFADVGQVIAAARHQLPVSRVVLFPSYSRSPLGQKVVKVTTLEELTQLKQAYEEEQALLEIARLILPVEIATATNFSLE